MNSHIKTFLLVLIIAIVTGASVYRSSEQNIGEIRKENNELEHNLEILKNEYECIKGQKELFTWQNITFELPNCWTTEEKVKNGKTILLLTLNNTENIFLQMKLITNYTAPKDQGPAEIQIGTNYFYQFLAGFDQHEFVLEREPYQLNILTMTPDDLMIRDILGSIQLPKKN
ncbi:MAG: hypothetical protein WC882_02400 [Candidatus Gracilibacteria bacterium]